MMKVLVPLVVGFCEVFRRNTKKVTKERERERERGKKISEEEKRRKRHKI